jgi:hypothetical protein
MIPCFISSRAADYAPMLDVGRMATLQQITDGESVKFAGMCKYPSKPDLLLLDIESNVPQRQMPPTCLGAVCMATLDGRHERGTDFSKKLLM